MRVLLTILVLIFAGYSYIDTDKQKYVCEVEESINRGVKKEMFLTVELYSGFHNFSQILMGKHDVGLGLIDHYAPSTMEPRKYFRYVVKGPSDEDFWAFEKPTVEENGALKSDAELKKQGFIFDFSRWQMTVRMHGWSQVINADYWLKGTCKKLV